MPTARLTEFKKLLAATTRIPIVAAPMFLVSGPDLVVAACQAGVIGAFPTPNCRTTDALDAWMRDITERLAVAKAADPAAHLAPWAVNLITHSTNTRLADDLKLIAKYKPPMVITALGSPKPAIDIVQGYGGVVIADVINLNLARKAVAAGADGIACVAAGAGGHTGALSPFAFLSAVREFFDGLVILGGGIGDGAGIAGAIAAGADLVYMGTSFIATEESIANPRHKELVVQSAIDDIIVSAAITGTPASWITQSLLDAGYTVDQLGDKPVRLYDSNQAKPARWSQTFAAGQGVGMSKAVESTAAVVDRLAEQYFAAIARLSAAVPCATRLR
jgi:nitronate monooxygenase